MSSEPYPAMTWEDLPGQLERYIAPQIQIREEYASTSDEDSGVVREGVTDSYIAHVLWLVPLAQRLESCPELRVFSPMVHHAVMGLHRLPSPESQPVSWYLYAVSEGRFRLYQVNHRLTLAAGRIVDLVEGDADTVIERLKQIAALLE